MKHGSLFSGIGGFDLAAEWMGWENVFHCEWNPFGQKVLKHYWPKAISYNDITKTDFTIHRGAIDIITGGFPCQPYSSAGKRLGKDDERHLWPEMLRAIREVSPRWIVGENVRGLTNWNGGMVFDEVQADLEAIGYEVLPFLLPACAVNAPHRRDRIWFVAYNNSINGIRKEWELAAQQKHRRFMSEIQRTLSKRSSTDTDGSTKEYNYRANDGKAKEVWRQNEGDVFGEFCSNGNATNTESERLERKGRKGIRFTDINTQSGLRNWNTFPTVSPICDGDDGLSNRLDGITFPKWRNESIKAGGNAVVPQVVYQIFKAIHTFETQNLKP